MRSHTRKSLAIYACLTALMGAAGAQADQGDWYLGGSGDVTWLRHSDTGGGANLDVGYRFMPNMRAEAEVGYHNTPGESGYADSYYFSYMGDVYYDFNQLAFSPDSSHWRIVPYIGGGLGAASYHYGQSNFANTFHHNDTDFAYQGLAGVTLVSDAMPNLDWVLGYRYVGVDANDIQANNIELGVRWHF